MNEEEIRLLQVIDQHPEGADFADMMVEAGMDTATVTKTLNCLIRRALARLLEDDKYYSDLPKYVANIEK